MSLLSGWFGSQSEGSLDSHEDGYELTKGDCYSLDTNMECVVQEKCGDSTPCHVNGVDACPRSDVFDESNAIYKDIQKQNPSDSYTEHLDAYKDKVGDNWSLSDEEVEKVETESKSWWSF